MHTRTSLRSRSRALQLRLAARIAAAFGLGCAAWLAVSATAGAQGRAVPASVSGEILVKYRPGSIAGDMRRVHARANVVKVERLSRTARARAEGELELLRLSQGPAVQAAMRALQADPSVEYVEPNWIYTHAATVPCAGACTSDPRFSDQWSLNNTAQAIAGLPGGTIDADIDAPEAWTRALGSAAVFIAVIDEGIDWLHEDLGAQPQGPIWTNPFDPIDGLDNDGNGYVDDVHGWDFVSNDNSVYDGSPADPGLDAHGTHVAGTIAAKVDNGVGVAGINWAVTVIPMKFLGPSGGTTANAVRALDYLVDLKVRHNLNIIAANSSWGSSGYSQALFDAIVRAAKADILLVASAGNGGADAAGDDNDLIPQYPSSHDTTAGAGYDAVIAVAATGRSDDLLAWSNFGAATVDLGAPGSSILSTTPQNGYGFLSGTSMAAPHVTGALALVNAARALSGAALRNRIVSATDRVASLQGKTLTGGRLNLRAAVEPDSPPAGGQNEIVLYASRAVMSGSAWSNVADASAAGGAHLRNPDTGAAKITTALSAPASYAELTFEADAGKAYRIWIRGRAERDSWANDSVYVQFNDSVTDTGAAAWRIGTADAVWVSMEHCTGCGLSAWGWQDNGYGAGVLGPAISFASAGTHTLRVQVREDGLAIDQIVLSAATYLTSAPGAVKNDTTILAATGPAAVPPGEPPPSASGEVVLYAAQSPVVAGNWSVVADTSAASGARLQNANRSAAKITHALSAPADYFELTFQAEAGRPYHVWLRGKAESNAWANDSVFVQFDGAVTSTGIAAYRIGSADALWVSLEDCTGCGVSGWGWQDNGYRAFGAPIHFAASGTQRIRIQIREDGLGIDQVVLSPDKYRSIAPGALKDDTTILAR